MKMELLYQEERETHSLRNPVQCLNVKCAILLSLGLLPLNETALARVGWPPCTNCFAKEQAHNHPRVGGGVRGVGRGSSRVGFTQIIPEQEDVQVRLSQRIEHTDTPRSEWLSLGGVGMSGGLTEEVATGA